MAVRTNDVRTADRQLQERTGTPYDAPPRVTYPQQHYPLQGPVEGATRRAHLVGTTSGSEYTFHAILLSWLIVVGFSSEATT